MIGTKRIYNSSRSIIRESEPAAIVSPMPPPRPTNSEVTSSNTENAELPKLLCAFAAAAALVSGSPPPIDLNNTQNATAKAGRTVAGMTINRTKSRRIISDTMMKNGPTC